MLYTPGGKCQKTLVCVLSHSRVAIISCSTRCFRSSSRCPSFPPRFSVPASNVHRHPVPGLLSSVALTHVPVLFPHVTDSFLPSLRYYQRRVSCICAVTQAESSQATLSWLFASFGFKVLALQCRRCRNRLVSRYTMWCRSTHQRHGVRGK